MLYVKEKKRNFRKKIYTLAFMILAGGISGCSVNFSNGEKLTTEDQKENLVIWSYYETEAQREGLDQMIRDFNQSQNEYNVSWEYVPMTVFAKGISSAYTENKLPDMVILDNPDMPSMIQLGMFEDITERVADWNLEEEYYSSIIGTVKYQNKYYGIPFNCNSTALIYNKKMLEEAGVNVPVTWTEFKKTADTLTTKEHTGFTMCSMEGEQGAFQILAWILAAGGTPPEIKGLAWENTFQFFSDLLKSGSMDENCINLTQTDVAREFADEKTAMMQNGPWVFPILDEAGIDYGIASIPGEKLNSAVLGGENIAIIKGKNAEGSLKFLDFCMNSQEIIEFCKKASVLPAKISAACEMAEENEKMAVFVKQMENAVTRTSIDQWDINSQALTDDMYKLVSGKL